MQVNREFQATERAQQLVSHILNRFFHDIASDCHVAELANAMYSVDGLGFDHGIPLGLNEMNTACDGEVDTEHPATVSFHYHQEEVLFDNAPFRNSANASKHDCTSQIFIEPLQSKGSMSN